MYHRIVCLTAETVEVIYTLGKQDRVVGISGYTTRPPSARREKPKVSAFTTAKVDKILELHPDLVLGFSNLQADIAADLVRAGIAVHVFNQRSLADIYRMIVTVGAFVDAADEAQALVRKLQGIVSQAQETAELLPRRPKVYFEEWDDPIISGIRWVAELIELAGGEDCFPELSQGSEAQQRIIQNTDLVVQRQPDIIIGSWCGKKFQPEQLMARPGWEAIPAVREGLLYEIKSADILQPGPSTIEHGLKQLQAIFRQWSTRQTFSKHWN